MQNPPVLFRFARLAAAVAVFSGLALQPTPGAAKSTRADTSATDYREPSAAVTELLTATPPPTPLIHARSGRAALLYRQAVIPLGRLAAPHLGLAGYRFNPQTGLSGVGPLVEQVELIDVTGPATQTPQTWRTEGDQGLEYVEFSPDGRYLSALRIDDNGPAALVVYDLDRSRERVLKVPVNAAWGKPCRWVKAASMICRVVPDQAPPKPEQRPIPIRFEHSGGATPTRTYSNLLNNAYEDALFAHYFTTELAEVGVDGSLRRLPSTRGMLYTFAPSPDGTAAIVTRLQQPWPQLVPARRFPKTVEVWDLQQGQRLYRSEIAGFGIQLDPGRRRDPREIRWYPDPSQAVAGYIQRVANDEGDIDHQWLAIRAPFDGQPRLIASSQQPIEDFGWTTAGTPYYWIRDAEAGREHVYVVLEDGPREIWSGDLQDRYHDPGQALRLDGLDGPVLEIDGRVFLAGDGLGPNGPRPFLDAYDLRRHTIETLYTGEPRVYEDVLALLDPAGPVLLTSRETEMNAPRLYRLEAGRRTSLRPSPDPYPHLANVGRRVIHYPRNDGVSLSGTLYTPAGWDGQRPLPTLIWIYPYEFTDRNHASQLDARAFRFHRVKGPSPLAAVLEGYAVLVNPTVPIVHDGVGMNDDYIEQLVASAEAAVDYLTGAGISDPARIAVGGRSYGAFSSANLLVHSDKFATAVAMSGAYNRTLTPFGFQHEKRSFWDATELYTSISPFFQANKINEPILLVHGGADPNPGTPPLQARRFFHALVGEGATVRYVELPYEGHHYWGRASVLDSANEMIEWLDKTIGQSATSGP